MAAEAGHATAVVAVARLEKLRLAAAEILVSLQQVSASDLPRITTLALERFGERRALTLPTEAGSLVFGTALKLDRVRLLTPCRCPPPEC